MNSEKQVLDALLDQYFLAPSHDDDPLAGLDFGAFRSFSQRDVTRAYGEPKPPVPPCEW
jgi:hypothetical protein